MRQRAAGFLRNVAVGPDRLMSIGTTGLGEGLTTMSDNGGSVTGWIDDLKRGFQTARATEKLWDRHFAELVRLARSRLANLRRGAADEEDVALIAIENVLRGLSEGRLPWLNDRNDLQFVLARVVVRKAMNLRRDEMAGKRGSGRTLGEADLAARVGAHGGSQLDGFAGPAPTSGDAERIINECKHLLDLLSDDLSREIAVMRMQGYLNEEIRAKLGVSLSSVERTLRAVRKRWEKEGVR
jgi:DNA-directed RNA polymerase specialized sigma24 family protein